MSDVAGTVAGAVLNTAHWRPKHGPSNNRMLARLLPAEVVFSKPAFEGCLLWILSAFGPPAADHDHDGRTRKMSDQAAGRRVVARALQACRLDSLCTYEIQHVRLVLEHMHPNVAAALDGPVWQEIENQVADVMRERHLPSASSARSAAATSGSSEISSHSASSQELAALQARVEKLEQALNRANCRTRYWQL